MAHSVELRRCNSLVAIEGIADIGLRWSRKARVRMTLNADFRRGFGATQCVKGAAIPTAKCSVSYSNTSSARCRANSGIARPSALAVFRLTANSNKAGCSIGSSPGLSPRRIRAT